MLTFRWGGSVFYKIMKTLVGRNIWSLFYNMYYSFSGHVVISNHWYLPGLAEEREMADKNNFNWNNTAAEQNENECLKYIEYSLRLLQQEREGVLSNVSKPSASSTSKIETSSSATSLPMLFTGQSSSRAATAADDFRRAFLGLASRSSGRNIQTYLPTVRRRARQQRSRSFSYSNRSPAAPSGSFTFSGSASGSICSSGSSGTWTHAFICLNKVKLEYTPSSSELSMLRTAGLGRNKVVFKNKRGQHNHVRETLEGYFPR